MGEDETEQVSHGPAVGDAAEIERVGSRGALELRDQVAVEGVQPIHQIETTLGEERRPTSFVRGGNHVRGGLDDAAQALEWVVGGLDAESIEIDSVRPRRLLPGRSGIHHENSARVDRSPPTNCT